MGFLLDSEPLEWEASLPFLNYIREHGIEQFLNCYHAVKKLEGDHLRWGDEIEYGVFILEGKSDDPSRKSRISLRSSGIIQDLVKLEDHGIAHGLSEADRARWMPEYGAWMLEGTPGKPFEGLTALVRVEASMMLRRSRLLAVLKKGEVAPTMTCFPLLGVGDFCFPRCFPNGPIARSLFVPDEITFPHPRFKTLTANIRKRRGSKVAILRRKFHDIHTFSPTKGINNSTPSSVEEADALPDVYADAMAFGMGCCCLQVTFQADNVEESRHLYDQISVLTPIMLTLSAATPILRGWLIDEDARWEIISQSVDDRTAAERGELPTKQSADPRMAGSGKKFLAKSRYSSMNCFMCNCKHGKISESRSSAYNDVEVPRDKEYEKRLINGGIDPLLAKHVSHLFARDPLVVFKDRIDIDDREDMDHWESLQSTNWQTVRWKPPPPQKGVLDKSSESHIGWRVEFRSMEIQLTDFENAAYVVFIVLLSRVILGLELNMYIPISKLDENMKNAIKRGSCLEEKFWFRKQLIPHELRVGTGSENPEKSPSVSSVNHHDEADEFNGQFELMTIHEILMGKGDYYPGLIPLCRTYLDFVGCDSVTRSTVDRYLNFIAARASGEIMTTAQWIRKFVTSHKDYKKDSRVPESTSYDLILACHEIGLGNKHVPELLGKSFVYCPVFAAANPFGIQGNNASDSSQDVKEAVSCAVTACSGSCVPADCEERLLTQYVARAIRRKVEKHQADLDGKKEDMEKLYSHIQELEHHLNNLKEANQHHLWSTDDVQPSSMSTSPRSKE